MLQIVDKIKLSNWLRWPHHQKASNGENPDLTNVSGSNIDDLNKKTPQPTSSRGCVHYRHKSWISHLNPLHSERRSCADIRDLQICEQRAASQPSQEDTQASKIIEAEDNLKDDNEITILLGDRQQGLLAVGTFKLNTGGKDSRIEAIKVKHIHAAPGRFHNHVVKLKDEQTDSGINITQEKLQADTNKIFDNAEEPTSLTSENSSKVINQLKNRVLQLKGHPKIPVIRTSGNYVEKLEKNRIDRNFNRPGSAESFCENSCGQRRSLVSDICDTSGVTNKNELRRSGSVSSKNSNSIESPETPKSSSDVKWWKLFSHSKASQKGPNCPLQNRNNPIEEKVRVQAKKSAGSMSTMGSPWNSDRGPLFEHGDHCHKGACQRRSALRSSYRQGRWITTDTEYVVLEL